MSRLAAALALAAALSPAAALAQPDLLRQARNYFEFGKYADAIRLVTELNENGQLAESRELVEAYQILGLSHFYLGSAPGASPAEAGRHRAEARSAFVKLLSTDPDYKLDPLLVPPLALEELERVRKDNEPTLAEIRRRRLAAAEEMRLGEEARKRLLQEDERKRRESQLPVQVRVERVEKHSFLSTLLPFGGAQFEQGRSTAGALFAAGQGVTIFASILSYTQVQDRIESNGKVQPAHLTVAQHWRVVNWVSFGATVATYLGGVADAVVHFQEERVLPSEPPGAGEPGPRAPRPAGASLFLAPIEGGLAAGVAGAF
jgi:hypothetical protein